MSKNFKLDTSEYLKNNIEKFQNEVYYCFDLEKGKGGKFDCDVSKLAMYSYALAWSKDDVFFNCQLNDMSISKQSRRTQKYQLILPEELEYFGESDRFVYFFRGDTITSFKTIRNKSKKLSCNFDELLNNYRMVYHTLGNFIPLVNIQKIVKLGRNQPGSINTGRAKGGTSDNSYVFFQTVYDYYNSDDEKERSNVVNRLFTNKNDKKCFEKWLSFFTSWESFVADNYLLPFVDECGAKKLFPNQSINNPFPCTCEEIKSFLEISIECIKERTNLVNDSIRKILEE